MIAADEDALICDFAETYHIYDYRALPIPYAAALACGLGENSRIKMHLSGAKVPVDTLLLATIADRIGLLLWLNTKDGVNGANRPASILNTLIDSDCGDSKNDIQSFGSADEFEAARNRIIRGEIHGN